MKTENVLKNMNKYGIKSNILSDWKIKPQRTMMIITWKSNLI